MTINHEPYNCLPCNDLVHNDMALKCTNDLLEINLQAQASILRQYEDYCYQITFHLIEDEQLAFKAACSALLYVARHLEFFTETSEIQKKKVKHAAMHSALDVIRETHNKGYTDP